MPPQRRKVVSCGTCRRLRTRCEKLPGLDVCQRCDRLRIECNLPVLRSSHSQSEAILIPQATAQSPARVINGESSYLQQRLAAMESGLAEIRGLLANSTATRPALTPEFAASEAPSPAVTDRREDTDILEGFSRTAPISVVRHMKHIIVGTSPGPSPAEIAADCVSKGLISESLCSCLFDGLRSLPLDRYGLDFDPWKMRHDSPLLFATCLLVGLYTIRSLANSQLHVDLFIHVEELVSKAILLTPLPLETVQAILMLSTWHLVPPKMDRYIDSWLMSGIGIMHGLLSIGTARDVAAVDNRHETGLKTWDLLCLTHLQFSVGTGCPPIISQNHLQSYITKSNDPWNQVLRAQSDLFSMVYSLIDSAHLSLASLECRDVEQWREDTVALIDSDTTQSLLFAYYCASLILCRHILKVITSAAPTIAHLNLGEDDIAARMEGLIELAISHAMRTMNLYLRMASMDGDVTPAFNHAMAINAAITVIEFKARLESPTETLAVMRNLRKSFVKLGRADEVIGWAVGVMEIAAGEKNGSQA